jgi:ABC-type dipeptide/oligopeptide/nickel transport system permease subunit
MMPSKHGGDDSGYQKDTGEGELAATLRELRGNRGAIVGGLLILVLVLLAIAAPVICPFDPIEYRTGPFLDPPSTRHPFGTDTLGRDVLSRTIYGTRYTVWIGVISVSISLFFGLTIGLPAGYLGGAVDQVFMRMMDMMLAFPQIILALVISTVIGPGLPNMMLAVGISAIPGYARVTRGSTLSVKEQPYVEAARASGCNNGRIIIRHILPNIIAPLIVLSTLGLASRLLTAAALGFLGLGAQPPTPEWGLMLSEGRRYLNTAWWVTTFPGLFIMISVLAINMFGDALCDALDPRLRSL